MFFLLLLHLLASIAFWLPAALLGIPLHLPTMLVANWGWSSAPRCSCVLLVDIALRQFSLACRRSKSADWRVTQFRRAREHRTVVQQNLTLRSFCSQLKYPEALPGAVDLAPSFKLFFALVFNVLVFLLATSVTGWFGA